jgi:hypothetical protein
MKRSIKECDRVIVPALVDGFGEDRSGRVMGVKNFMDRTHITVHYDHPDPNGRTGIAVYEHQIVKIPKMSKKIST